MPPCPSNSLSEPSSQKREAGFQGSQAPALPAPQAALAAPGDVRKSGGRCKLSYTELYYRDRWRQIVMWGFPLCLWIERLVPMIGLESNSWNPGSQYEKWLYEELSIELNSELN